MAYSTSPVTVRRMLPQLEPILKGSPEVVWRTAPNRAAWLAYKLREALAAAAANPEEFPELARARYRVEVMSSREVRATQKDDPLIEVVAAPSAPARVLTTQQTPEQIVQEWRREGRSAGKLYFPDASLSGEELRTLWEWAQEAGVLLFENAGALTLLPLEGNESAAEYAWDPSELDSFTES